MDKIVIRRAQHDDLKAMAALLEELFGIEKDFTADFKKQLRGLELLLTLPTSCLFVAKANNRVVAMVSLQELVSTAMGGSVGIIEDMIVTQKFRGQGVGRELFKALLLKSEELGYARLCLGSDVRNSAAEEFYRGAGFEMSHMGLMYKK